MPRRGFLVIGGTFVAVGAVLAVIGRFLGSQVPTTSGPPVAVPPPRSDRWDRFRRAPSSTFPGLTPLVVANEDFYLIDTRLGTPEIDASTWSLRIFGMVDQGGHADLRPAHRDAAQEQYVTIACVSNEVGGHLVGNAKWTGVSLNSVLAMAGVQPGATQVVGHSYDGWTSGFPTEHLSGAGKDALIVVQMNGEPLPARHGFPARVIVPGPVRLRVSDEVDNRDRADHARGLRRVLGSAGLGQGRPHPDPVADRHAPRSGQGVPSGQVQVAGVAWAPTRGISKVEVDVDTDENWRECQLSLPLSNYTWVQWQTMLGASPGSHTFAFARPTEPEWCRSRA